MTTITQDIKTPILVIEDQKEHWKQVKEVLEGSYDLKWLQKDDELEMQNYLALSPEIQIIIVDLYLGNSIREGMQIIEKHLWPANRTAFFIVFSEHLEKKHDEGTPPLLYDACPHIQYINKQKTDNNKLEETCLGNLKKLVDSYYENSSPTLVTPYHNAYGHLSLLPDFEQKKLVGRELTTVRNAFKEPLVISVERLNLCVEASKFFSRAGMTTKNMGIGVFGSCGRLESRVTSDIECTVYFNANNSTETRNRLKLACQFWNRLRLAMTGKGIKWEGANLVENKLLIPEKIEEMTADFSIINNEFIPVIDEVVFDKAAQKSHENILNKTFQLLTEMQPIFNPQYLYELKERVLQKVLELDTLPYVWELITCDAFGDIFKQFSISTHAKRVETSHDLKKFTYRTFHILSTRIELIRLCTLLTDEPTLENFFDRLLVPPLGKLISFYNSLEQEAQKPSNNDQQLQKLLKVLKSVIENHANLIRILGQWNDKETADWQALARKNASSSLENYNKLFNAIEKCDSFESTTKKAPWLCMIETATM